MKTKVIPEIDVDLDAPAGERWIPPGKKIAERVQTLTQSVLDLCSQYLPSFMKPLLCRKAAFASLLADPLIRIFLGPLFDECKGLSKATGIPAQLLAVSNCAYDVSQLLPGFYPTACSTGVFHDAADRPVMVRFMDWSVPENIARFTTVVRFHSGDDLAYSSLGFAGFLGVVTAVGPAWAVALNQAPSARVRKSIFGHPACYAMRMACDRSGTFTELRKNILAARPFSPFLSLLCGAERGEVVRIEKPNQGRASCVRPTRRSPQLVLSNHYVHRNHRSFNGDTEWVDEDGQQWISDTHERLCHVRRLAREAEGCQRLPGLWRFEEDPVRNNCTVHLALMRPATGTLKFRNYPGDRM